MKAAPSKLLVAVSSDVAMIKICGRASFMGSADFKAVVYELRDRGCHRFVLDLSECLIMDSTFLGILAGFAMKLASVGTQPPVVELRNPNPRILELLDNLGVAHLFRQVQGAPPLTECAPVPDQGSGADKATAAATVLEAHQNLMDINPANIPKFKDVARFLAEDLRRTGH